MVGRRKQPRLRRLVWITDDIAVSAAPSLSDWHGIAETRITGVVDLTEDGRSDGAPIERLGLRYVHVPVNEGAAPSLEQLAAIADWIVARIADNGAVLVHCREGRGRSALVVVGALMRLGFSAESAYTLVRRAHPGMALSSLQLEALEQFARRNGGARKGA